MFIRSLSLLSFSMSFLFATQLIAAPQQDDDRFYVKADLGSTTYNAYESTDPTVSESKVGDLFAFGIGLEVSPIFAFELTHNEFGKQEGKVNPGTPVNFDNKVSSNALSIIPTMPLGDKTNFFVELGEHVWQAKSTLDGVSSSSDGSDLFYGFGFSYDVKKNFRTGFEYSHYDIASDNFKTLNVSLAYLF